MNILCEQWAGKSELTARTGRRVASRGQCHPLHHPRGRHQYLQQLVLPGSTRCTRRCPGVDNVGGTSGTGPGEPSGVYLLRAIISGILFHRGSPLPRAGGLILALEVVEVSRIGTGYFRGRLLDVESAARAVELRGRCDRNFGAIADSNLYIHSLFGCAIRSLYTPALGSRLGYVRSRSCKGLAERFS